MSLQLVYDGACPFCRHFALRAELAGGLPQLQLRDARRDPGIRRQLRLQRLDLARGAVLLDGRQAWHGSAAIAEICRRMHPSDALLALLRLLFRSPQRARRLYPLLLLARRWALRLQGLTENPEETPGP
ncbi:MAG: DUF393 domain-containing protein [Cyanobacteria bacterium K_Offshore_0m_m2_072]|nr:DUF393 domain-containing protein [Cyanobacteria bacterium K_Offshore_0m_m2_072]